MYHVRLLSIALLSATAFIMIGCESGQKTGGGLDLAIKEFERQEYEQSREQATRAMRASRGVARDEAAYIAGLSAFELGMIDEAERRFMAAARSSDTQVAANASAMLGQIRLDQARYEDAIEYFETAAPDLRGEDARQARQLAGLARRMVAGDPLARREFRIETAHAVAMPDSGFALQVGAFRDRSRASRSAEEARRLVDRNGMGPVQIVPTTDRRGRTLYLVRIGHFETRHAATKARQRLGRLDYIVAAWGGSSTGG